MPATPACSVTSMKWPWPLFRKRRFQYSGSFFSRLRHRSPVDDVEVEPAVVVVVEERDAGHHRLGLVAAGGAAGVRDEVDPALRRRSRRRRPGRPEWRLARRARAWPARPRTRERRHVVGLVARRHDGSGRACRVSTRPARRELQQPRVSRNRMTPCSPSRCWRGRSPPRASDRPKPSRRPRSVERWPPRRAVSRQGTCPGPSGSTATRSSRGWCCSGRSTGWRAGSRRRGGISAGRRHSCRTTRARRSRSPRPSSRPATLHRPWRCFRRTLRRESATSRRRACSRARRRRRGRPRMRCGRSKPEPPPRPTTPRWRS